MASIRESLGLSALLALVGSCDCDAQIAGGPAADAGDLFDASHTADAAATDSGGENPCSPGSPGPEGAVDEAFVNAFDGVDDAVHLGWGDRALFHRGQTISVMGWVSPTLVDGYDTVVARPTPCGNGGNFSVDLNGGARVDFLRVPTRDAGDPVLCV